MTLRPIVRAVTARIVKRNGKTARHLAIFSSRRNAGARTPERSGPAFRRWTGGTRQWLSSPTPKSRALEDSNL